MKTELKRLPEKAENIYLSKNNNDAEGGSLVLILPEDMRANLENLAEELYTTFSIPSAIKIELSSNNLYNVELTADNDTCTIGQVPIDTNSIAGFRTTADLQLSVRIPEKVILKIEDIVDDLDAKKANIPAVEVNSVGEMTVSVV